MKITSPPARGAILENPDNDDPTGQALTDFADSIINNTHPVSNVTTGAKAAISVRMALDAMVERRRIDWDEKIDLP